MNLCEFIRHRLLIITGKGGVGKTITAAALANAASESGKNTLLVESGQAERCSEIFGSEPSKGEIVEVKNNFFALSPDPEKSRAEFGLAVLKVKLLYSTLNRSSIFKYFLDAVPGLNDLVLLNTLASLESEKKKKSYKYDHIIFDAPATGHCVSLLKAPRLLNTIVRVGPIKTILKKTLNLIHDSMLTSVATVVIPEQMPVNETIELRQTLENELRVAVGPCFVNQVLPDYIGGRPVTDPLGLELLGAASSSPEDEDDQELESKDNEPSWKKWREKMKYFLHSRTLKKTLKEEKISDTLAAALDFYSKRKQMQHSHLKTLEQNDIKGIKLELRNDLDEEKNVVSYMSSVFAELMEAQVKKK